MAAALTEDLVEEVLVHIPPEDPASLVGAALVSKRWCRLVCGRRFRRRFGEFHGAPPLLGLVCPGNSTSSFISMSTFHRRDSADRGQGFHQHLDCHDGPFIVSFVWIDYGRTFICTYSSEADRWSEPAAYVDHPYCHGFEKGDCVLVGSAVYFKTRDMSFGRPAMLKYDLLTRQSSPIYIPTSGPLKVIDEKQQILLTGMEGRLGFAFIRFITKNHQEMDAKLCLWSMEHGPDEDARRVESRVMDLVTLLQEEISTWTPYIYVVASADSGSGVIFLWSEDDRLFSLDLKSESGKMVGRSFGTCHVVPYMSLCTPALGAFSIDEGLGAGEPSA